ncbi:MAG: CoA transferase [SAR202 cluster bacterium]|nr:CoA transferase [SAR202 cluster bacterium]
MDTHRDPSALSHLSVLDLTKPEGHHCGKILADLGASVVKVEPPNGDSARSMPPFATGVGRPDVSLYFANYNTNKLSIILDLESAVDVNSLVTLAAHTDVIIENFKPGYLERLGLGFEAFSSINPGLIMASITPFGQTGPYRDFVGSEIVMQAMGGLMYCQGDDDKPPCAAPCEQASQMASYHAAFGILAAINHRNRSGKGQHLDVSTYEVVSQVLFNITRYSYHGDIARRTGAVSTIAPNGYYRCKDGYVSLAVLEDSHWQELVRWMDLEALSDAAWNDMNFRRSQPDVIDQFVREFISSFSVSEFLEQGHSRHLAVSRVNEIGDLVESPQMRSRRYFTEISDPQIGQHLYPGVPYRFSHTPVKIERPSPQLGEHQDTVLDRNLHEMDKPVKSFSFPEPNSLGPLDGLRILDLSRVWSGPFTTRYLGDLGAEVIKVESEKYLDTGRKVTNSTPQFLEINRSKKGVTLDFQKPEGLDLIKDLIGISDVVVENFAAGVLERRGLGYPVLRDIKPDLVMLSMPGYGNAGPYKDHVGYGQNLMSYGGLSKIWGFPDSPIEARSNVHFPDFVSAVASSTAVLAALEYRTLYGVGQHIEVAQIEAVSSSMGVALMDFFINGKSWEANGNQSMWAAPSGSYPCQGEDQWCAIACSNDKEWFSLRKAMGDPNWAFEQIFDSMEGRVKHFDKLNGLLSKWTIGHEPYKLMTLLQGFEVPAGVVQSGKQLFNDNHLREKGFIVTVEHSEWGNVEHPGIAINFSDSPGRIPSGVPRLGEHNQEVFSGLLGMSQDDVRHLTETKVIA